MTKAASEIDASRVNRLAIILERALGSFAGGMLAPGVVLTVLVRRLGGGALVVGGMQSLMVVAGLAQLVTAWRLDGPASRRRYVLRLGWAAFAVLPVLALALWAWGERAPGLALGALLAIVFARWAVAAMLNPALLDLARRLIPAGERVRVFAVRQFVAALFGLAAGGLTHVVLRQLAFPNGFVVLFLAAAAGAAAAWSCVWLIREPPRADCAAAGRRASPRAFLARLVELLRPGAGGPAARHFRRYVAVRHAVFLSRCAYPFLTFYALTRFRLDERAAGGFLVALWAGRLASGLALSLLPALRASPHQIIRLALGCTLAGLAVAVLTPRWEGLLASFLLQGMFLEAYFVADPILLMDHAPPRQEVLGMSLTMVALYPMNVTLPLVAGLVVHAVGFPAVAAAAAAGAVVAFVAIGRLASRPEADVTP